MNIYQFIGLVANKVHCHLIASSAKQNYNKAKGAHTEEVLCVCLHPKNIQITHCFTLYVRIMAHNVKK